MRALKLFLLVFIFAAMAVPAAQAAEADEGKLLKAVVLSRHGVRSPTQSDKTLSLWSEKTWPSWPVARGELTARGAKLVTAMWRDMRSMLIAKKLWPNELCPPAGSVYVRADVDERTRATARAILDGLASGCKLGFEVIDGEVDPLFHPVKAGLYRFDPVPVATDVLGMAPGGLEKLQEDLSGPLALLDSITGPASDKLCARFTLTPDCAFSDIPNAVSVSPEGKSVRLVGGLAIASSIAEIFLLEYGQWPGVAAGWGQVNATTLSQILPVHARIFDVVNRAPVVAWARGGALLTEIAAALAGDHYNERVNRANLVIFVGHDTNIANIGGLLGVNWRVSGYPLNSIPPAGNLWFELWEKNGRKYVALRFYAQTPKALHAPFANEVSPPGFSSAGVEERLHAPLAGVVSAPPMVGQARFELGVFRALVSRAVEGAPLPPRQTPKMDYGNVLPR